MIGQKQLGLLIMATQLHIGNYRPFNYHSDFAEHGLKGVYICQDDACEILSQSDYPFKSYNGKFKYSIYVYQRMRRIRFHVNIFGSLWPGI